MKLIEFKSANKYSFGYSFPSKRVKRDDASSLQSMLKTWPKNQKKKEEFTIHEYAKYKPCILFLAGTVLQIKSSGKFWEIFDDCNKV